MNDRYERERIGRESGQFVLVKESFIRTDSVVNDPPLSVATALDRLPVRVK